MSNLFHRLCQNADNREPILSFDDLSKWPEEAISILESMRFLQPINLADSIDCQSCGQDHVEPVIRVSSPVDGGETIRSYIFCPELGRVEIPSERLERWAIHFHELAKQIAEKLDLAGEVQEIERERLWSLGLLSIEGTSHQILLLRGLNWGDQSELWERLRNHLFLSNQILLVLGAIPDNVELIQEQRRILPIESLVSIHETKLVVDRSMLVPKKKKNNRSKHTSISFPTPSGTSWKEIHISTSEREMKVEARGIARSYSFEEAGFGDGRSRRKPNHLWNLLRGFAVQMGELREWNGFKTPRGNLKQYVNELSKVLKQFFQLTDSPIPWHKVLRCYQTRFSIRDEIGVRFPTPEGTEWSDVSIRELVSGKILISISSLERFSTLQYHEGDRSSPEVGEQEGCRSREFTLQNLNLADDSDRLNKEEEAFVELLRTGGRIRRNSNDRVMLRLGKLLSRFMQIDSSPFQYVENRETWTARFEAESDQEVTFGHR